MMDDKSIEESAKAVQEVAKTTGKAIDAGEKVGGFIAKFISAPLEQGIGIFEDKLKYMRWERQVRLMKRSEDFLKEIGLSSPNQAVPLNIAIPLIQAASLEENDDLQDRWAKLLVNASNKNSGVDIKKAYISILEDLSPLDVKILDTICSVADDKIDEGILTYKLPDGVEYKKTSEGNPLPTPEVQLSLGNLIRLGCLTSTFTWGGKQVLTHVESTILGRSLYKACTLKKPNKKVL